MPFSLIRFPPISQHCQYITSGMRLSMDNQELEQLGEPSLKETREEREMRLKLQSVESQLNELSLHAGLQVSDF